MNLGQMAASQLALIDMGNPTFPAVQQLGLRTFTALAWVQSLGREVQSHKPHFTAKISK